MAEQPTTGLEVLDAAQRLERLERIAERSRRVSELWLSPPGAGGTAPMPVPYSLGQEFFDVAARMLADPQKLAQTQIALWHDYLELWQQTTRRVLGQTAEPVAAPEKGDRRFKHTDWDENALFDFIKQSYLLSARCLQTTVQGVEGLDETTRRKVDFYTRQFVDALAPTNFAHTNPEVLRATLESGGENLIKGLENLLDDLEHGKGQLSIRMTDREAFRLGENVATTPGKVVYQNELMQLIQYAPTTEAVAKRPLLIVPPWINKFYILDLREKNSFIRWAVDQGNTVFVISWVDPDERQIDKTWDDYMALGPLDALDQITKATGERKLNAIGYCIGGTLLASTLAYMAAKRDRRITSATYFTAMVDFADAGELSVFLDEEQIKQIEDRMEQKGYLDASSMATTFNMLRANDLIWSFVVSNYLMGKEALPFDLLYWNSDSTRMPAATHRFYLRSMYQNNLLREPGGLTLKGVPIDLRKIKTPTYLLSTREDHIAPWKTTYAATQLYQGPITFVLAGSGHIAGVVNPPAAQKYGYWTNPELPADPEAWLAGATQQAGSWWPHWAAWLEQHAGGKVRARVPGDGDLPALEDAPGSYVKARS